MNNLKLLRTRANMKQTDLAKKLGIAQSTLSGWETGKFEIDNANLNKLALLFDVSIDYLLGRDIPCMNPSAISDASSALTPRDNRDIARDMAAIEASLESGEGLMFNGEPLSPEAKESLLAAMRLGLEAAKLKNKERFTPKKYRKD